MTAGPPYAVLRNMVLTRLTLAGREVRLMVNLPCGSEIPPVSRFRLLVASVVLGAVVAVGAIAFLAACRS